MRFAYMAAAIARLHERASERSRHFSSRAEAAAVNGKNQPDLFRRAAYYHEIALHLHQALIAAREASL